MISKKIFPLVDVDVEGQEQGEDSPATTFSLAAADVKCSVMAGYDLLAYP